jgi:hypothetical protein
MACQALLDSDFIVDGLRNVVTELADLKHVVPADNLVEELFGLVDEKNRPEAQRLAKQIHDHLAKLPTTTYRLTVQLVATVAEERGCACAHTGRVGGEESTI